MGIFDVFKGKSDMEIAGDNQVDELDKGKVKEFDLNVSPAQGNISLKEFRDSLMTYSDEELKKAGLGPYYTDHGVDVYPQSAAGVG